jgi:hypothetical protein
MNWAALADKGRSELVKHPFDLQQNLPKALSVVLLIRSVGAILAEADWFRDLIWHFINVNMNGEFR